MVEVQSAKALALIGSLGLADNDWWSAKALLSCLQTVVRGTATSVPVVDAALRGSDSFYVLYRKRLNDHRNDQLLGSEGNRDADATLRLMPHFDTQDVPLDPREYGVHFVIVAMGEPFGSESYAEPDE